FVAANRSSGVGRDSASIAEESTSFANLRDRNCSSRWLAVSRKSMAIHLPSSRTSSARQPTSLHLQQADHSYFGDGLKQHAFAPGVAIGGGDARGRALHEPVAEKLLNLLRGLEQLSIVGAG